MNESVDNKMKENVKEVKRSIGFINSSLANVRCELVPEKYFGTSLTQEAFSTLHKRFELVRKDYERTIQELERMEQFYPIKKRNNILGKIKIVKNALESLDEIEKDLDTLRAKLQGLPVKIFN